MDRKYDVFKNHTSDEEITEALEKKLDVIGAILEAMQSDDENDSAKLLETYKDASRDERALLDYALVCITGYTMSTMIENAKNLDALED